MSRTSPTDYETAALDYRCEYCKVNWGEWCVTVTGRDPGKIYATWLHSCRIWPIQEAFSRGYQECERDLFNMTDEQFKSWRDWQERWRNRLAS